MTQCKLSQHLQGLVSTVFQHSLSIVKDVKSSDMVFLINWRLGSDSSRPNKRSKTIRLVFPQDLIEDYLALDSSKQLDADKRIFRALASRIQSHDPEHDCSVSVVPPEVEWIISTHEVNF